MIRQIEEKVVNRLRQVTSAIKQEGANQVSIITSTAERQAAIEFAKAAAIRPNTLGQALPGDRARPGGGRRVVRDPGNAAAAGQRRRLTLLPAGPHGRMLATLLAAEGSRPASSTPGTAPPPMGLAEPGS